MIDLIVAGLIFFFFVTGLCGFLVFIDLSERKAVPKYRLRIIALLVLSGPICWGAVFIWQITLSDWAIAIRDDIIMRYFVKD